MNTLIMWNLTGQVMVAGHDGGWLCTCVEANPRGRLLPVLPAGALRILSGVLEVPRLDGHLS